MKSIILKALLIVFLFVVPGCVLDNSVVYVPDGQAVRLRETIRDVKVWVLDENKQMVEGKMDIPAGWYCLPDTYKGG